METGLKLLALQNCESEHVGVYATHARTLGHTIDIFRAYTMDGFPDISSYDAILIGGTPTSANDIDQHPFLQEEYRLLSQAVQNATPCLGICFGAQLLARVLTADIHRCETPEIGGYELELTATGQADPVLQGFPESFPVFQWHGDTFDVPEGASLLATGQPCRNQMYRMGNAVGVQFHLEIDLNQATHWTREYANELPQVGKSSRDVQVECLAHVSETHSLAKQLLVNFLLLGAEAAS